MMYFIRLVQAVQKGICPFLMAIVIQIERELVEKERIQTYQIAMIQQVPLRADQTINLSFFFVIF
jgi:hypothetical protein